MAQKTVRMPDLVDKETGEVTTATLTGEGTLMDAVAAVLTWERQGRPIPELLSTRLTLDELREFGGELAGICEEIGTQASHEDSVKKELKAIMARLEARRDELASVVRRREQLRSIDCIWERHYGNGLARKIRLDTGEVIQSRPLQDHERQPPLLPEVADKAAGAAVVHSGDGKA